MNDIPLDIYYTNEDKKENLVRTTWFWPIDKGKNSTTSVDQAYEVEVDFLYSEVDSELYCGSFDDSLSDLETEPHLRTIKSNSEEPTLDNSRQSGPVNDCHRTTNRNLPQCSRLFDVGNGSDLSSSRHVVTGNLSSAEQVLSLDNSVSQWQEVSAKGVNNNLCLDNCRPSLEDVSNGFVESEPSKNNKTNCGLGEGSCQADTSEDDSERWEVLGQVNVSQDDINRLKAVALNKPSNRKKHRVKRSDEVTWTQGTFIINQIHLDRRLMYNQGYHRDMTLSNREASFTSYVDFNEDPEPEEPRILPRILEGEMPITEATRVCHYTINANNGLTSGTTGSLFVTNMKLSFRRHVEDEDFRTNLILSSFDIPLSSIFAIHEVAAEISDRKKKLVLGTNIQNRVDGLLIHCKNFKLFRFSFKFSGVDMGRKIANTLLHHVRPLKDDLLFAYEHGKHVSLGSSASNTQWGLVKHRSQCPRTRICRANENWQISRSLPQEFIIPDHVSDGDLTKLSNLFRCNRPPVWVWGLQNGASIFVQPAINIILSNTIEKIVSEFYGTNNRVDSFNLDKEFCTRAQFEDCYSHLIGLHCIEFEKDTDTDYLSKLENTGWLTNVSTAISLAEQTCKSLREGKHVALIEGEGRSSSIVVASLAQILLGKEFRSRAGFQTLIQNNFVSLGFPFSSYHQLSLPPSAGETVLGTSLSKLDHGRGLAKVSISSYGTYPYFQPQPTSVVPLFLLFLDCVFQLTQQFPSMFEFLPEYLIALWDSALLPMFDTFLFDCELDRSKAQANDERPLRLHPVWDWERQFSPAYIKSWLNPLYAVSSLDEVFAQQPRNNSPPPPEALEYLPVQFKRFQLAIWTDLFYRSVTCYQRNPYYRNALLAQQTEARHDVQRLRAITAPGTSAPSMSASY